MKKQMKLKMIALAVAVAILPVMALAGTTDSVTAREAYSYEDASGNAYTEYDFAGSEGSLIMSDTQYCGSAPCAPSYPALTSGAIGLGAVNIAAGGDGSIYLGKSAPSSQLLISGSGMTGTGDFTVDTDRSAYSVELAGNQSLGASDLTLSGPGTIDFGDATLGTGVAQTLQQLNASEMTVYDSNVSIGSGDQGGLTLDGDLSQVAGSTASSTVKIGGYASSFAGVENSGANPLDVSISGILDAPGADFNASGNVNLTFNNATLEADYTQLDAANVVFGSNNGGDTILELQGGQMTVDAPQTDQYGIDLNTGNGATSGPGFRMTGGTLVFQNSASDYLGAGGMAYADIYSESGYSITAGNVIFDGESGKYKAGDTFTLLQSGAGVSNTFAPSGGYYVYNGAKSSTIDGYDPELMVNPDNVQVVLNPPSPTPAPAPAPAKSEPAPAPAKSSPAPAKIIPVKVVTPVEESKPIVADSVEVTQAAIQNTTGALVSTGVVGGGPRGAWLKTLGGFSSQGGYNGMDYGLISGYGFSVGPNGRDVLGAAFSAGQAGLGTSASDFTKASDYGLWIYGTYYPNASRNWKITGTIGGGMSTNTLSSTALGLPQVANFNGSFMGAEVRASYWKTLDEDDGIIVSPRLSVGYNQSWTNGYSTHGGGPLDVQVSGQSDGQLYFEPAVLIGKKFNYRSQSGNHTLFPQLRLGAVENVGPSPSAGITSGQVAGQVQGLAEPHLQGMAEVRLDVISHTRFSEGLSANVSAKQLFGSGASSTEFVAAIKYHW